MEYKSLVTGGAGFIGGHVVDALVQMGHDVIALDDLSGGFTENVNGKAKFIQETVVNPQAINSLFDKYRFDFVFHLAAYAAEGLSHFIRGFNYTNNVIGSINIINASVNYDVKCLVFTSSIAVYGPGQVPMREDMSPSPEDPYGIAKFAVELDLAAARKLFGLNYIVFRPHNVYGERQNTGDKYRNVIGIFMNQILQNMPCSIFGDGRQTRAFTYISDIAPVIARSVDVPEAYGDVFNIGADTPYTVCQLAKAVQDAMGNYPGITYLQVRDEVVHAFSDHGKAKKVFNYEPQIALAEGLMRMAAWVKGRGSRTSRAFEGIEIEKKLPPAWRGYFA